MAQMGADLTLHYRQLENMKRRADCTDIFAAYDFVQISKQNNLDNSNLPLMGPTHVSHYYADYLRYHN